MFSSIYFSNQQYPGNLKYTYYCFKISLRHPILKNNFGKIMIIHLKRKMYRVHCSFSANRSQTTKEKEGRIAEVHINSND